METNYIQAGKVVEVFKTNVNQEWQARLIIQTLQTVLPEAKINFDLDDCDKILRVERQGILIDVPQIEKIVYAAGCYAEVLR